MRRIKARPIGLGDTARRLLLAESGALYNCADSSAGSGRGSKVIALQQLSTARFLERSQIVRSSENYRLDVMANDWWGEPLGAMLSRVLIEELSQRLPQSTVFAESGAVTASPDATIELNIQRLDEDAPGNLVFQAQASIVFRRPRGTPPINWPKALTLRFYFWSQGGVPIGADRDPVER